MCIEGQQTECNVKKIKWKIYKSNEGYKRVEDSKSEENSTLIVRSKLLVHMYKEINYFTNFLNQYFPSVFVLFVQKFSDILQEATPLVIFPKKGTKF